MPQMHIGCQTITWGQERATKIDEIVATVAGVGYEGIEYGSRFLDLDAPEEFRALLERNEIELAALHMGWRPGENEASETLAALDQRIEFAEVTGTPLIIVSGWPDAETVCGNLDQLQAMGRRCADAGMTLCYHNHYWEALDDAAALRAIADGTDPALVSFCPDIAWVRKATKDVIGTLEIVADRVPIVHFKDYLSDDLDVNDDETEFGKGILDFDEAFEFLRGIPSDDLWIMAEQMCSAEGLSPEESIHHDLQFLREYAEGSD
ncbi:MAG: TIM barrel protein [Armatimonadia bacterium]|nr:TIM barrel protein [Armatimonadia bacterium]